MKPVITNHGKEIAGDPFISEPTSHYDGEFGDSQHRSEDEDEQATEIETESKTESETESKTESKTKSDDEAHSDERKHSKARKALLKEVCVIHCLSILCYY